ncbi:MAG: spore photoproduct lyase family protein [Rhodospirillaceae bacterium]|nr:spore photoproduct lyase family protein [Rhodospirillales bacterium]
MNLPLDIGRIYVEPAAALHPRGAEILARFPLAERIEVASHCRIPELNEDEAKAEDWVGVKRTNLVLGIKKTLTCRPNGRSSDFIAPSHANGCAMACAYCYVSRRKGFANPITTFVNIDGIAGAIIRHARRQGAKPEPNQVDPNLWVYDMGENGDCSVDAAISDNVRDLVDVFRSLPNAKGSFATKWVNRDLLALDPQGHMRIRFSLMPPDPARRLDVRTSPVEDRVNAINDFVAAGWEVHVNFSPVVVYDGWTKDYAELFTLLADTLSPQAKAQLAAEIIMLTHNADLHAVNLRWHPKAEELLWTPQWQEEKVSQNGMTNIRYRAGMKAKMLARFRATLAQTLPECRVRYAF